VIELSHPLARPMRREFAFTAADFARVRKLIHARAGIALGEHKQEMVYSRLAHRLRARGMASFNGYLDLLEVDDEGEWEGFINALTTNLTSFFREAHHFEVLAGRMRQWARQRRCRVWCAGSSTGEEPYSAAMTLVETLGAWAPPGEVIATDLDTEALCEAERGCYASERMEKIGSERTERFFTTSAGVAQVRGELRRLVRFQRLNLLDREWPLPAPFDAIFCRNVLIYFDKATQRRIVERFRPLLRSDGLLFLGHAEGLYQPCDAFRSLGRTVYEPTANVASTRV
jgi:chemotaxis protein methyltransferase CheR